MPLYTRFAGTTSWETHQRPNAFTLAAALPLEDTDFQGVAGRIGAAILLQLKSGFSPPRAGFWAVTSSYCGRLLRERGGPPGLFTSALGPASARGCVPSSRPAARPRTKDASRMRPLGWSGMCALSPWQPNITAGKSDCSVFVGIPVDGPLR